MADEERKCWKAGTGQKIEKIYAWVATEEDGGEGILGVQLTDVFMPLVGADLERMESFRGYATAIGRVSNRPVALKVFGKGVVVDEL